MPRYFIDSNVFLRYYSHDDAQQSEQAKAVLLKAKAREIDLYCGPPVFFEVAWVLKSTYGLDNGTILDTLEAMLGTPNLQVIDGDTVKDAISLARAARQGFADSYIAATAQRLGMGVVTFNDKHFSELGTKLYPFGDEGERQDAAP
jgi:predicted nucleic acid-binding protein